MSEGTQDGVAAGREVMLRLSAAFDSLARAVSESAAVNTELVRSNRELVGQVQVLVQHEAALMEHMASLQQQIAALTLVESRRVGLSVAPVEQPEAIDPLGALGRQVVNGFFGQQDPPRRRRGR